MKNVLKTSNLIIICVSVFLLISCGKGGKCPDLDMSENELIKDYHTDYFNAEAQNPVVANFAIYLDYSSGMKIAFADEKTEAFYNLFINSLKISSVDFYEVNKDQINKIENLDKSELYKKIKDSEKYSGINAPLDQAVTNIVKQNSESVFITDGELWQNGERDDPWAREEFGDWLKAGNTIEFYVTDHVDAKKEKHLFYMFFIPKEKATDKTGIANVFKFYLENSAEAKTMNYTHFVFSSDNFTLSQDYKTATSGGVNVNAELDPETFINEGNSLAFEFHEYFLPWDDMMKYIFEAYDDNGKEIKGGEPLISKLFLEAGALEFYNIEELGIKVYDLRDDFDKYRNILQAKQNPPTLETNENGKQLLDEENNPILKCPGQYGAYNEITGKLLIDTNFVASKLKAVDEIFKFDQESFMNSLEQQGKGEIIIKIHPNFNGIQISDEVENLHRIDIYLKKVTPNTSNPNLEKFIWDGKQVDKNRSIYNSVLGALNEANPEGKVIYSYYIKTQPNDFYP